MGGLNTSVDPAEENIMDIQTTKSSQQPSEKTSYAHFGATVFIALVGLATLVMCITLVVHSGTSTHAHNRVLVDAHSAPVTCAKPDNVVFTGFKAFMSLTFADLANLNSVHFAVELPSGEKANVAMRATSNAVLTEKTITVSAGSSKLVVNKGGEALEGKYFDADQCKGGCPWVLSWNIAFEMKANDAARRKSDKDGLFAFGGENVTRGNLKNLVIDKPSPITVALARKSDKDGMFAFGGENVTRGNLKNLVVD